MDRRLSPRFPPTTPVVAASAEAARVLFHPRAAFSETAKASEQRKVTLRSAEDARSRSISPVKKTEEDSAAAKAKEIGKGKARGVKTPWDKQRQSFVDKMKVMRKGKGGGKSKGLGGKNGKKGLGKAKKGKEKWY